MTILDDWPDDQPRNPSMEATSVGHPARHLVATAICLLILLVFGGGCRSMLELPDRAKASGYDPQQPAEEGWLFRRLTGQKNEPTQGATGSNPANTHAKAEEAADTTKKTAPSRSQAQLTSGVVAREDGDSLSQLPPADSDTVIVPPTQSDEEETEDFILFEIPSRFFKMFKPKQDEALARTYYQEAMDLYRQQRYEEAAPRFKKAARHWQRTILEEDALFLAGEAYFFADRYARAEECYQELLKKYEFTHHLDTVSKRQFAIGRYWEQVELSRPSFLGIVQVGDKTRPTFDTWGRALKAYQNVRLHDPTGPLADDAIMATANAYFLKQRYEDAAYHYDLLRKDYPQSEHAVNAAFLAIKSHQLTYQGPLYDGTPLEKAEQAADEILAVYNAQLGDEREEVIQAKNRITEEKALRYFAIGQYYDNRKYYGAARYYYRATLRDFPHTKAAVMAAERIRQIDGLPDKPPNRFKWLTDLFERRDG